MSIFLRKMKSFISFFVLLIVLNEDSSCYGRDIVGPSRDTRFTPEAVIHQLAELIRILIRSGDAANEVPVLDPYEFQQKQINLTGGIISANVNIINGKLIGLGNFKLQELNFSKSEISIELKINIPSLEFNSECYELDGDIFEAVPIQGQGVIQIEVFDVNLHGIVYLKQSKDGKAILLKRIEDAHFTIERVKSQTQFDNNIDDILNAMVEDLLASYLNRFSTYIAETYKDTVVQYLNPTLEKFDTWNLIAVLLSA